MQVITQNKLLIHVESGDIFYENHNTGKNFCNFLLAQQNGDAAFIPKKIAYRNTFKTYISQFLPSFSLDDIDKYKLMLLRTQNICFIVSMIISRHMVTRGENLKIQEKWKIL